MFEIYSLVLTKLVFWIHFLTVNYKRGMGLSSL
jgi:hypothetical protein